ncbi:MAG: adenylate/guanylate cyclase domain-containing protein [Ilumatobacteraceae bacterium]
MATRLAAALVLVTFAAIAVSTIVGLTSGIDLGRQLYEERLTSLSNAASFEVASGLQSADALSESLSSSSGVARALEEFTAAYDELATGPFLNEYDVDAGVKDLVTAYQVAGDTEIGGSLDVFAESVRQNPAAVYLQASYNDAAGVDGDRSVVDDALDGSQWSEVNSEFQSDFRRLVGTSGILDITLVDTETRVVYSEEKGPELGTSLRAGPFSGSVLANTVDRVLDSPEDGVAISDVSWYGAQPDTPVFVFASPVFDSEDVLLGVVTVMYDGEVLTDVVTADQQWDLLGVPESGDVYLIGRDGTTRTDPRGYLTDPNAFLDLAEESGRLSADDRAEIVAAGTTVLTMSAPESTVAAGSNGGGVEERRSLVGIETVGTTVPVDFEGVDWMVVAEMDRVVAESALDAFGNILVVGATVFIIFVAFFAVAWAGSIMRPVRRIAERLGNPDQADEPLDIPDHSPIELHDLAARFVEMSETLQRNRRQLDRAHQERLEVMRSMLPPAIADRALAGELDHLDVVPRATVAVVTVLGLGELVHSGRVDSRMLVDRVTEELDALAEEHGLDRIKMVGDAYFAACGHDEPYIDHAPRATAFAMDVRQAVRSVNETFDVTVGVQTGPVTVGMSGGAQLVYDVWGDTVSGAHVLARVAATGQAVVSAETQRMLPDDVECRAFDVGDEQAYVVERRPETAKDAS